MGGLQVQSFFVKRSRDGLCAGPPKRPRGPWVARVLDPHTVAGVEQNVRGEGDGLLGAGDDDDLLRRAVDAPRVLKVFGESLAQGGIPSGLPVAERGPRHAAPAPGSEATPRIQRERIEGGKAGLKGPRLPARLKEGEL